MKFLVGLFLSACLLQVFTIPAVKDEDANAPKPTNEIVDAFRDEVNRWFSRYMVLYERTTAALTQYRILHVHLIAVIYDGVVIALGDSIEEVRQSAYGLIQLIADRRAEIGDNACFQRVVAAAVENSEAVGLNIQQCALYGNTTLSENLISTFYPTFATIQEQTSTIPLSVTDILRRGNILQDEQEILQYLADRYQAYEMQWLGGVSQLLRWESSRFNVEGRFLADETSICMDEATVEYLLTNSRLEGEVQEC